MKLPRRKFLHLAAGAAALPAVSRIARAQTYPSRPVRIIVGFPAGGGSDIVARLLGQWMTERLGQSFIIENRPGAGTNIAIEAVVRAPADGYTEFIAYARVRPDKINMGSAGNGTPQHLSGVLFMLMTGTSMIHVPYRGDAPALTELLGGQTQLCFAGGTSSIEYVRTGKLRALAVTTASRLQALPDVPTVGESVPGYEASGWQGLGAPKNTPAEIIERLNKETNAALADPTIKARLLNLGGMPMPMTPSDFGKFIAEEVEKWAKVIRAANIKPE
jgi:tripartite-type tricarboxylate transporter receptor subunit TctC